VANLGTQVGTIHHKHHGVLPWILGLILLALLLAGLIFFLHAPRAVGVDDGAAPVGNVHEPQTPRSLRQYA